MELSLMASSLRKDLSLRTLRNVLGRASDKWFLIGIQLGIPSHVLKQFKKEDDPLSEAIDYWLAGNVLDEAVPVSWKSIVEALQADSVEEVALAKRIAEKYCQLEVEQKLPIEESFDQQLSVSEGDDIDQSDTNDPSGKIDPDVRTDLEYILKRNLKDIMTLFAAYVDTLRTIIREKGVSPEDLRSYLLSLPVFKDSHKQNELSLLANKKSELEQCNSITEIFNFLKIKCASFLDFEIFEDIVMFYKVSKDQEHLNYFDHLHAYIHKHKISEFVKINPLLKNKEGSKELVLKYDIRTTCHLAEVTDLKIFISDVLGLLPSALEIVDVEDGCVIVTFLIPAFVADVLFTPDAVFTPLQKEKLQSSLVLWLKCNGHTYKFQKNDYQSLKERLITCSICLGTYTDPKQLHCNHVYCMQCLVGLVQQDQQRQFYLICPKCRQITPVPASGVTGLQSDFRTNQLLEFLGLGIVLDDFKAAPSANLDSVSTVSKPTCQEIIAKCSDHHEEMKLFCETCQKTVCLKCVIKGGRHVSHDNVESSEALANLEERVSFSLGTVAQALAHLDSRRDRIFRDREAREAEIHNISDNLGSKNELISQLHQQIEIQLKEIGTEKDQVEITQIQLNRCLDSLKEARKQGAVVFLNSSSVAHIREIVASVLPKGKSFVHLSEQKEQKSGGHPNYNFGSLPKSGEGAVAIPAKVKSLHAKPKLRENLSISRPKFFKGARKYASDPADIKNKQRYEEDEKMFEACEVKIGTLTFGEKEKQQVYAFEEDDIEIKENIGAGVTGEVYRVMHKPTGKFMAAKKMLWMEEKEYRKRMLMDLIVMSKHESPYIVKYYGSTIRKATMWIFMELMTTNLDRLGKLVGPIPEVIICKMAMTIVKALNYLKTKFSVIHRDVKPSNMLLDRDGSLKLCDMSMSGWLIDSKAFTRGVESAAFIAPERINQIKSDYDSRADVWSLGISLVQLVTGKIPYSGMKFGSEFELLVHIVQGPPPLPNKDDFSPQFYDFLSLCLTKDVSNRPQIEELLKHPLVEEYEVKPVDLGAWLRDIEKTVVF